ncbi:hypothetical protein, partial [Pseudomonas brassicae]|uniref:hypothetical protein n=1 Tax=Pseudomonas brassicae TaxID=2708063 RepID=UPI001FB22769
KWLLGFLMASGWRLRCCAALFIHKGHHHCYILASISWNNEYQHANDVDESEVTAVVSMTISEIAIAGHWMGSTSAGGQARRFSEGFDPGV